MAGWYCAGRKRKEGRKQARIQIHFARAGLEQSCHSKNQKDSYSDAKVCREDGSPVYSSFDSNIAARAIYMNLRGFSLKVRKEAIAKIKATIVRRGVQRIRWDDS